MQQIARLVLACYVLGAALACVACQREPHDGFYDREHHRWYHEHQWRDCGEHDEHCR